MSNMGMGKEQRESAAPECGAAGLSFSDPEGRGSWPGVNPNGTTKGGAAHVVVVILWLAVLAGLGWVFWQIHVDSKAATGNGPLYNVAAGELFTAMIFIRWARRWMGYGTTAAHVQVRGHRVDVTPKWDQGQVSFSIDTLARVTVTDPAFAGNGPRMTLIEKSGRRHTLRRFSETASIEPFLACCREAGAAATRGTDSQVMEILYFGTLAVLALVEMATFNPVHPVRTTIALSSIAAVVLLLAWIHHRRRQPGPAS